MSSRSRAMIFTGSFDVGVFVNVWVFVISSSVGNFGIIFVLYFFNCLYYIFLGFLLEVIFCFSMDFK